MTIDSQTAVTAAELAAVLGITDRRVRQLVDEGVFERASRGRYPLAACVQAYLTQSARSANLDDYRRERTRLLRQQADRAELENAEARGDLTRTWKVIDCMAAQGAAVMNALSSTPARRCHEIAGELGVEIGPVSACLERVLREELKRAGEEATAAIDRFVSQHGSLDP